MARITLLGALLGHKRANGTIQTGYAVYGTDRMSPTILARAEGGRILIVEKTVKVIGQMSGTFEMQGRVYDKDGLCPAIRTFQGGGLQPKIVDGGKLVVVDVHNKRKIDGDVCGTITAHRNASPTTCGTFGIVEQSEKQDCKVIGGLGEKKSNGGTQYFQQDRVYYGDIQPAQPAQLPGGSYKFLLEEAKKYRIRKLTPRECWRLMGFTDGDFDRAASVNSNSQLYKQAGNSIVRQVLMAIFSQMNIKGVKPWNERQEA